MRIDNGPTDYEMMKGWRAIMVDMYSNKVLIKYQYELEEVRNAIEKRDLLLERWNNEEQSWILPAESWGPDDRIASSFSFRAVATFLFSLMLVFPAIYTIPLLLIKQRRRRKLKKSIILHQTTIKKMLPIPINEDFDLVAETYWGKRFIENGIIFSGDELLKSKKP